MAERFAALFEHMEQGVAFHEIVCDERGMPTDYRILDMNPQYEKLMGLDRSDAAGKLASTVYGTEPPYLEELSSVGMGGPPVHLEVYHSARKRHFSISVTPLGPRTCATIFTDITLSKIQAEAIEENRLSLRALLDNQPHLAWLKDREGRFLAVNRAFADACGQPDPEALVGKTDRDVWPQALAEAYRAEDQAVLESGLQRAVEEEIANVDGVRRFETYKSPVYGPGGDIVGTTGVARDITDRKRAENDRLQSERRLGQILDLAPDPIAVAAQSGELVFANRAFCSLLGHALSELVGRQTTDLWTWADPARGEGAMGQLHREGHIDSVEIVVSSRNGSQHYLELAAALIRFDGSTVMIAAARDVTESRLAEENARKAAETLAHFFSLSLDLLCIADEHGRFVRLNPEWESVLGLPLRQLESANSLDWVHPDDLESTLAALERLRRGERVIDFRNRYRHADGSWRWLEWRAVRGDHGLNYGVARDVTRRVADDLAVRVAEQAAARTQEQLLRVSEVAHIGHFTVDLASGAMSWTPELYRIFGRDPQALVPSLDEVRASVLHRDDLFAIGNAITLAAATGQAQEIDFRALRPNGDVRYCLSILEVTGTEEPNARRVYGLVQDLTESLRVEEERRKLEQQVMHSQKLESLGVLAGGIAHDFNNLLTSILGNADLALSELSPSSSARLYLEDIEKVSRRAADLCRQMLAYSGRGRFVVQTISLNDVVREMVSLLAVSISKKVSLRYNFFADLPSVRADATQLRQVIMNLITNASEAIGESSGVVTLSTGVQDCDGQYWKGVVGDNDHHQAGQYVFVEVSDTGVGMDPETQSKIFDPFFTTKFTGRGLGLAAVLGIVRGHKGALRVKSQRGRGSSFKMLLPAYRESALAAQTNPDRVSEWRGHGMVLLADDEASIRSMGQRILERAGFEVALAADGREALEVYAKHGAKIRLVVLDMTMPHLDGEACCRELRRMDPSIKVIMTSGYNEQEVVNRFADEDLAGFVQKPYKASDLLPVIREVLGEAQ